jgi:hypothetical protein
LKYQGEYLEASWSNGATTVFYPVGGDNFMDRVFWAQVRFTRDTQSHVTGLVYKLMLDFNAKKISP